MPSSVIHTSAYLVAHEGHQHEQIILAATAMAHRLPATITIVIWHCKKGLEATAMQKMKRR
ncbi:MAG TPA: hypothetical protein VHD35_14585 [Chitinophagaceae bacterium]|nr:hypothetical protein [Chitinophagaceae bacterium]